MFHTPLSNMAGARCVYKFMGSCDGQLRRVRANPRRGMRMPMADRLSGNRFQFCCSALLSVLSILLGGCACPWLDHRGDDRTAFRAPDPPAFLTGPARVLLTNHSGFKAHASLEMRGATSPPGQVQGELFVQENWLLFEPDSLKSGSWRSQVASIVYLWDVSQDCGYAMNLALQGFTTITSSVPLASLQTNTDLADDEVQTVNRLLCHRSATTFTPLHGPALKFHVWRADDLHRTPVRVESLDDAGPFTVELSNLRPGAPALALFAPPDGFTRYESVQAMLDEILNRAMVYSRPSAGDGVGMQNAGFYSDPFPADTNDGHRRGRGDGDRHAGHGDGRQDGHRHDGHRRQ